MFCYLLALGILANAVGTALLLEHVWVRQEAGQPRTTAIALPGVVTVSQVVCVFGGGVCWPTSSHATSRHAGFLLALTVGCVIGAAEPARPSMLGRKHV